MKRGSGFTAPLRAASLGKMEGLMNIAVRSTLDCGGPTPLSPSLRVIPRRRRTAAVQGASHIGIGSKAHDLPPSQAIFARSEGHPRRPPSTRRGPLVIALTCFLHTTYSMSIRKELAVLVHSYSRHVFRLVVFNLVWWISYSKSMPPTCGICKYERCRF
jgi:hypothetical protein